MDNYFSSREILEKAIGTDAYFQIKSILFGLKAADVAEVRHGRWEFLGPNRLIKSCMCGTCSVCHVRSVYIVNTAICPNCGARMDKEGDQ